MTSFTQLPGTLNLAFRRGDDFSANLDFSINLSGFTLEATLHSAINDVALGTFAIVVTNAAEGLATISLTDTQSLALAAGTYYWRFVGTSGDTTRTYLSGFVEVSK